MVSKIGYSAEYVESITPTERKLIMVYYEEELNEQRKRERQQQNAGGYGFGPSIGSPINTM